MNILKRKILVILLAFAMVFTMMPTVGYAVEEDPLNLYVNGVLIYTTDTTKTAKPNDVVGVQFDKAKSKLTLNGATINNGASSVYSEIAGILANFPLTINLVGNNNRISIAPGDTETESFGIRADADLTITGGGEPYNKQ